MEVDIMGKLPDVVMEILKRRGLEEQYMKNMTDAEQLGDAISNYLNSLERCGQNPNLHTSLQIATHIGSLGADSLRKFEEKPSKENLVEVLIGLAMLMRITVCRDMHQELGLLSRKMHILDQFVIGVLRDPDTVLETLAMSNEGVKSMIDPLLEESKSE